jgi:molybdopterin molybdotransferase
LEIAYHCGVGYIWIISLFVDIWILDSLKMPEFLKLIPPASALKLFLENFPGKLPAESIAIQNALGRITAFDVIAEEPLPPFPRSTVDGYAVRSADTYGASESLPAYLAIEGEVPMGEATNIMLSSMTCAIIHTGGMVPASADAVVMLENTQAVRSGEIEVLRPVAPGENVIQVGEDVRAGQVVIQAGSRIRPEGIGGLAALGIDKVRVSRKPKVAILSTGDEVVPINAKLMPGQVRDVNTYSLAALVEFAGGTPISFGIIPDDLGSFERAAQKALQDSDILVVTAGSSASQRDFTSQVINRLGSPGVLVHGVNIRPGKPTILANCDGKPVIGLPGNPVSALVIAQLFVVPIIECQQGLTIEIPKPAIKANLTVNLASQAGREDWIPIHLIYTPEGCLAEPIYGKSNLIFTLVRADGMVCIPADATGLSAGQEVEVIIFQR